MIYLYSIPNCPRCEKRKKEFADQGVEFTERDGTRLQTPEGRHDQIDVDAFVQLSMQNLQFPVEVEA